MLAANVEPSAMVATRVPMPKTNLKGFLEPERFGLDGSKFRRDM